MRKTAPVSALPPQVSPLLPRLTEADLAHLWEGQRFPPGALRTTSGEPLRTIYRGRRAGGPGPDFRDAIIAAPGGLLQGDVELHVRSGDFRRHGHHQDPAYDGLALHLVFHHDEPEDTQLACGRRVPVAALADWIEGRAREIRRWLEGPALWQEPCFTAVERLGGGACGDALDRLGDMRFRAKAAAWARRLRQAGADQALWEGVLEALGYGGGREIMRALAQAAPWGEVAASLAGVPGRQQAIAAEAALSRALAGLRASPASFPAGGGVRPGNRPEARLPAAAALAARFAPRGPWGSLAPLVAAGAARELLAALTVPGSLGRGRALEVAANAVLPCAAANGLGRQAEALYRALPLPARYGAVRHLHTALAGAVAPSARRQQGMLYLLREHCSQGGCGRCPLS